VVDFDAGHHPLGDEPLGVFPFDEQRLRHIDRAGSGTLT
jgi:hypothetical protein